MTPGQGQALREVIRGQDRTEEGAKEDPKVQQSPTEGSFGPISSGKLEGKPCLRMVAPVSYLLGAPPPAPRPRRRMGGGHKTQAPRGFLRL